MLQKQLVKDDRAADDVEFWGAKGKEGFRVYLEKKYGSILAGWRALDREKCGRLSFCELCNACRGMGYHGNLKKLWSELDTNKNNFVTMMEIDEEVGHYVGTYKLALMKKYGDMLTAWRKGMDFNGNGRIEEKEIARSLKILGITDLEPKKLYKMLTRKGLGLTMQEFDPDSYNRWCSGDFKGLTMSANKEFIEDVVENYEDMPEDIKQHGRGIEGGAREWRQSLERKDRKEHFDALAKVAEKKAGLHTADGFKKALQLRCGSLLRAWRGALDLDGNGRLTFGEFCVALDRLGLFGDVKGLWKQLDPKGTGFLVFSELDPETDAMLSELQEKLTKFYGNMLLAWLKALDVKGTGLVAEPQFVKACAEVGFSRDSKLLFKILRPHRDRAFLTLKDFDNRAYLALSRGDFRMISESDTPSHGAKGPLELNFHERQEASSFYQLRRSWEAAQRQEFAKACRVAVPDFVIDTHEEFEDLCIRKYGSLTSAWRALDSDANGKLTFAELCCALRQLGYAGDFKALWKHYDCDKTGHIMLKDIAPRGYELLSDFLQLLNDKYGDLDAAWKYGFNRDPHDSIDQQALAEACQMLGYKHDAGELFRALSPNPGRVLLTIWDIDPECTRKRQRGQVAYISSEPKDAVTQTGPRPVFGSTGMEAQKSTDSMGGDVGGTPAQRLRQVLRLQYASTPGAWRIALDPKMQGSVSFGKFLVELDNCSYNGSVKRLWEDLTQGGPTATFADIDPDASRNLADFRELLLGKFGCLAEAWHCGIDIAGVGRCDQSDFVGAVEALGKTAKQATRLFKLLLTRSGQRSIICDDLVALLIGVTPDMHAVVWAGAPRAAEPDTAAAAPASPPQSPAGRPPPTPGAQTPKVPPDPTSPREFAERIVKAHHEQDIICKSVDGFKKVLTDKFGSLYSAWRLVMDVDHNGLLTQHDLAKACQFVGVKAVTSLWVELDPEARGQITLKTFDPEVSALMEELEMRIMDKYKSTRDGWRDIFDPDNRLRCDLPEWKVGCVKLGFKGTGKGSAERLYKLLRPEPGRAYLTYEDIWINKNPNAAHAVRSPKAS